MDIAVLLGYILAVVVLIGTPGPIVALVMNAASRHGFDEKSSLAHPMSKLGGVISFLCTYIEGDCYEK